MHRLGVLLFALALCLGPGHAMARTKGEVTYPFTSVWTTLVRLVRVDLGCAITEKDKDEGYVLFDYQDAGRTVPGTIELVRSKRGSVEQVSLVVQIPAMPSYVERMVIDRLERKLREELGAPRTATPPPTTAPPTTTENDDAPADAPPSSASDTNAADR